MSSPVPEDFERLLRLLALKRSELPPPGYFDDFSFHVIAALRNPQSTPSVTWWKFWVADYDFKPVLAGAFAMTVCGLFLLGLSISQILRDGSTSAQLNVHSAFGVVPSPMLPVESSAHPMMVSMNANVPSPLNPVLSEEPPDFLFNLHGSNIMRTSFQR